MEKGKEIRLDPDALYGMGPMIDAIEGRTPTLHKSKVPFIDVASLMSVIAQTKHPSFKKDLLIMLEKYMK